MQSCVSSTAVIATYKRMNVPLGSCPIQADQDTDRMAATDEDRRAVTDRNSRHDSRHGTWVDCHRPQSYPGPKTLWAKESEGYAEQLQAYADAIREATGRPVVGKYIHSVVGGGVVEVM